MLWTPCSARCFGTVPLLIILPQIVPSSNTHLQVVESPGDTSPTGIVECPTGTSLLTEPEVCHDSFKKQASIVDHDAHMTYELRILR